MNRAQLIARIDALRVEATALNNACLGDGGVIRSMTDAEDTAYKAKMVEVKAAEAALARFDEAAPVEPPEVPSKGVRSAPPGQPPAAHAGPPKRHSINRLIRIGAGEESFDGLEREVHDECVRRGKAVGRKYRGLAMPTSGDADLMKLMGKAIPERRDVTTTTIGSAIFVEPMGDIDLLRANLVIDKLGATFLRDLQGVFAMVRQNSTNTLQWIGEGASVSPTNLTFDRVPLSPKFAAITSVMTREAMMQTSVDLDRATERDFAVDIALGIDYAAINGPGLPSPIGLLNIPTIPSYVHAGGNGGPFTYNDAVNMESLIAGVNADRGDLKFLTNPRMRGSLKQQYVGTAGFPVFVWQGGSNPGQGEIAGVGPAYTTTQVPNNLTKGSATNCSAVILAYWPDLIVAQWDTGIDMVVDPYTMKRAGSVEVTMYLALDINIKHPESFAICADAIPQY